MAVNRDWRSKWYADKREFGKLLTEDYQIRELLKKRLESASVPKILIERAANRCRITILTARPGVVIGRKGAEIDKLKEELSKMTGKEIYVDIMEIKQPEIDAQLVARTARLAQTNEQLVTECRAKPAQRHADGGLAHAEALRGAAHVLLVVERKCNGQQVEVDLVHDQYSNGEYGLFVFPACLQRASGE